MGSKMQRFFRKRAYQHFRKNIKDIVCEFDNLEILDIKKPKVGLVGEILVKFHPLQIII